MKIGFFKENSIWTLQTKQKTAKNMTEFEFGRIYLGWMFDNDSY